MCLIVFAWDVHPKYKLILAANRDEFYDRPTAPAGFWEEDSGILGGKDLQAGGSWMTVSDSGKMAAVTNFRDVKNHRSDASSRGFLTTDFMHFEGGPEAYLKSVHDDSGKYNGFNLLTADLNSMWHFSNYERKLNPISRGIHGLSNALLNTPWPKIQRSKETFSQLIDNSFSHEELIDMMADDTILDDEILPDTGVPPEVERSLSAMCIRMENYGTCCSTVITMDRNGKFELTEKSYPVGGRKEQTLKFEIG